MGAGPADSWATTLGDPAVAVVVAGSSLASVAVARCRATNRTIGASPPRALLRALRRTGLEAGGTATAVLLVFWDASCTACEQLLPYLRARAADPADDIALAIVSTDGVEATRTTGLELPVIDDEDRTITHALAIPGKPAAILLDSRGRIASDLILGTARIAAAIAAQAPSRER